jgi:DNA-binding NarL/FixJ family response regulator
MTKEQVSELNCKKHVKVYKLNQLGLSNKDVALELKTNVGHVFNVLKKYKESELLRTNADLITN